VVVSSETPLMPRFGEPALRLLLQALLDEREEDSSSSIPGLSRKAGVALLGAQAEMDEHGGVAAVVEDHVRRHRRRHSKILRV
jgi:hypothetical protein